MKKILVVITTAFTPVGGLTAVAMNYYRFMDLSRVHIDFCSSNDCDQSLLDEILSHGSSYFKMPGRSRVFKYWRALKNTLVGYDVVHIHANSQTAAIETTAAKVSGVGKIIVHNHTSRPQYALLGKLVAPIYHATYTDALACSKQAGEWLFGESNYLVLNNAIDVDKFAYNPKTRDEYRKMFGIKDDEYVIGHIGKFMDAKNHPFLIKVFAEYHKMVPDSRLLLVGDGPWRPLVEKSIADCGVGDAVILAGLRRDIQQIIQSFDIFVFPSVYEGLPLTVLEAQSSGLACVMSSNVTHMVHIAENNHMLDLDKGERFWADFIRCLPETDRNTQSEINRKAFTEAGYNIKTEASKLLDIYLN